MNILKIALIPVAVSISGCMVPYQEPASGSTASIEFINNTSNAMMLETYDGAQECTDRKQMGAVGTGIHNKKISLVKADTDVAFAAYISSGSGRGVMLALGGVLAMAATDGLYSDCTPSIMFKPNAGESYVFSAFENDGECKFTFSKKISTDKEEILKSPKDFTIKEWNRGAWESSSWCSKVE